ncbi:MAG: porin family protein [Salinibacter sp.]
MNRCSFLAALCTAFCFVTLAAFPVGSQAQNVRLGIDGGLALSTFRGDTGVLLDNVNSSTLRRRASFQAGGFAMIQLNEWLDLRPGLYYIQKGAVLEGSTLGAPDVTAEYRFPYVQIPILFEARIPTEGITPSVSLGPVASFSTASGVEIVDRTGERIRSFERITETLDLGAMVGVGMRYLIDDSKMLIFDLRYNPGLLDIISEEGVSMRTDAVTMSFGYAFSL